MPQPPSKPIRIPLGSTSRRTSYERRLKLWIAALGLPSLALAGYLLSIHTTALLAVGCLVVLCLLWLIAGAYFFEQLTRPLQTLSNVVAALREDDFSFRARGARRGDSLGDLALEINALAGMLQQQSSAARDALTLVERVMSSMQSPVLAFDPEGRLRLINQAAETSLDLQRQQAIGQTAEELKLTSLLEVQDESLYNGASQTRWSVRRTTFRLHGIPHTLLVLSDVAAALREEERLAWQRLIRVLSHEINNSLTPIKSIAGSLRTQLPSPQDMDRGLAVIENRAASLNRFLQAYQQLTFLPPPKLQGLSLSTLLQQVVPLETRIAVELKTGVDLRLEGDPDQLQQLLINLIRNAAEAALSPDANSLVPHVEITWSTSPTHLVLHILDNGPGLSNSANLFVPFYTTKPEGSGIGLVLAQHIASAHKGSVALFNREQAPGCIAELRLPLTAEASSQL